MLNTSLSGSPPTTVNAPPLLSLTLTGPLAMTLLNVPVATVSDAPPLALYVPFCRVAEESRFQLPVAAVARGCR